MPWYMRAYPLSDLKRYEHWDHAASQDLADDTVVYLHESLRVTKSAVRACDAIFDDTSPAWAAFCRTALQFAVPDWRAEAAAARHAVGGPPPTK